MYGDFILLESDREEPVKAQRLALGETAGRNEAWLRDTLFEHPELLPIGDIDPAFRSLTPLCTELRTEAGPLDIAFVNPDGKLVLVECKLWRNPEARRKVVAQVLDYARVIQGWSYADLQRQVSAARNGVGQGNIPYELIKQRHPDIQEQRFVDQAQIAMKSGRFLLLIAGDGIREDVDAMTQLINRNSASGFSFGLVEVALYGLDEGGILAQPRVIAKTKNIERTVVILRDPESGEIQSHGSEEESYTQDTDSASSSSRLGESPEQAKYRTWWRPILEMSFDDPEQEPPQLFWRNNVRISLPWPNMWLLLYCMENGRTGICTAGRRGADQPAIQALRSVEEEILSELPEGSEFGEIREIEGITIRSECRKSEFETEEHNKKWLMKAANKYVNALRPRLNQLLARKDID